MRKKRYAGGGGVPTSGGDYNPPPPQQYPFPSQSTTTAPMSNMTVTVGNKDIDTSRQQNPFKNPNVQQDQDNPIKPMRKGGKVKPKVRGDGIAQRGRTKGKFV